MGRTIGFILLLLTSLGSIADSANSHYNRINLSVNAQTEVDNDTLIATLYAQEEGNDTARLAREVNRTISAAVKRAKQSPNIQVQTLDYTTRPIYRQQTITGWRVRQSIQLQSSDTVSISELIGELQKTLALDHIQYAISAEARTAAEEQLITEAIQRFKQRAKLIQQQMGNSSHKLVQMNINSSGHAPRPPLPMARMAMAEAAAPTLESGSQTVSINISGTIELQ